MQLDLNDVQLKAIIGEAILRSIDLKTRDGLISSALQHLIAPQSNGYGKAPSILETAFREQVSYVARDLIREQLQTDDAFKGQVRELIANVMAKAIAPDGPLVEKMAESLSKAISGRDY